MIDLSKHIQEGARLELEAMERLAEECSFCSSMSAQHNAQAMRIDELQADLAALRAQLAERDAELAAAKAAARLIKDDGDAELAALKAHAEAMADDLEYIYKHDDASGGSEALPAYRAAYPKE